MKLYPRCSGICCLMRSFLKQAKMTGRVRSGEQRTLEYPKAPYLALLAFKPRPASQSHLCLHINPLHLYHKAESRHLLYGNLKPLAK